MARFLDAKPEIGITNLGAVASAVMALNKEMACSEDNIHDDLKAFWAPSECYSDCYNSLERWYDHQKEEVFRRFGITEDQYKAELKRRIKVSYELHFLIY